MENLSFIVSANIADNNGPYRIYNVSTLFVLNNRIVINLLACLIIERKGYLLRITLFR